MKSKIYFISGVCGVGKSSVIPYLKELLSPNVYDIRDFDERGVPDGADSEWRKSEVKKWLEVGSINKDKSINTIVCGFVKSTDLDDALSDVEIILLDADSNTIRNRLMSRYSKDGVFNESQKVIGKPVNEFIESNVYYCNVMRKECAERGCRIIDTSHINPREVAQEIVDLIVIS